MKTTAIAVSMLLIGFVFGAAAMKWLPRQPARKRVYTLSSADPWPTRTLVLPSGARISGKGIEDTKIQFPAGRFEVDNGKSWVEYE